MLLYTCRPPKSSYLSSAQANSIAVLRTLLSNLIKDSSPGSKFRRVKKANAKIAAALAVAGAEAPPLLKQNFQILANLD